METLICSQVPISIQGALLIQDSIALELGGTGVILGRQLLILDELMLRTLRWVHNIVLIPLEYTKEGTRGSRR